MPELTSDGKYKWGNVKRNSKKELAQTVYGIWKANGGKGSFHNFYHYGNPYGKSKKHKKEVKKESYNLNPLSESSFWDRTLFDTEPVTINEIKSIRKNLKQQIYRCENPSYKKKLENVYWNLKVLTVSMRREAINSVPLSLIEKISANAKIRLTHL